MWCLRGTIQTSLHVVLLCVLPPRIARVVSPRLGAIVRCWSVGRRRRSSSGQSRGRRKRPLDTSGSRARRGASEPGRRRSLGTREMANRKETHAPFSPHMDVEPCTRTKPAVFRVVRRRWRRRVAGVHVDSPCLPWVPLLKPGGWRDAAAQHHRCRDFSGANPLLPC